MKRVQAIVSGKKKQCTKLPTPEHKDKKETSPSKKPALTDKNGNSPTKKKGSFKSPSRSGITVSPLPAPPSSASNTASPSHLITSSTPLPGSTASLVSTSSTATDSTLRGGNASSSSTPTLPRAPSRIPASPKKASKDGKATSSKSKPRQEADNKTKLSRTMSESAATAKRFLRDKNVTSESDDSVVQVRPSPRDRDGRPLRRSQSNRANRKTVVIDGHQLNMDGSPPTEIKFAEQREEKINNVEKAAAVSLARSNSAASSHGGKYGRTRGDSASSGTSSVQSAANNLSGKTNSSNNNQQNFSHNRYASQESKSMPTYHSSGQYYTNYGALDSKPVIVDTYPSQPPRSVSRASSRSGCSDQVYQQIMYQPHPAQAYQAGYGSLPRSRSTTPTADFAYSSGSLSRGSNTSTPTPVQTYNAVDHQGWNVLSRRAESDSGFMSRNLHNNGPYHKQGPYHNEASSRIAKPHPGNQCYYNNTYGVVPHPAHTRSGSVPPPSLTSDSSGDISSDSMYGMVPRPGSVPPHYFSDTDTGGYPSRGKIMGPEVGTYGRHPTNNYESDSGYSTRGRGLRVHPDDERYRVAHGKRPVPRRHTVGVPRSKESETERKKEAFMQLLAQRYPQYADKIQGKPPPNSHHAPPNGHQAPPPSQAPPGHLAPPPGQQAPPTAAHAVEKPARSRDAQRRRTAVVTYDPAHASNTLEYDDLGTMSDLELPSFQRGGFTRTSLPIVRSASTSLERPLGLVFLVFADQTKKSLLPNEITTLDTVRALFVRAFPDLSLEILESPRRKIYILDPATSIYFQLEDLAEIKDRSVLKIHETDNDEPQKVKEKQEVRGRTIQMPSRPQSRQGYTDNDMYSKSQSLPPQMDPAYPDMMQGQRHQWEMERRSRSRTPEDADRPRSMSAGSQSRPRDRMPTPERGVPLNPIPENRQIPPGYRDQPPGLYEQAYHGNAYPNAIYEVPPNYHMYAGNGASAQGQTYVARSTRAPALANPQRAMAPAIDSRGSNRHSLAFAPLSPPSAPGAPEEGRFRPPERPGDVRSQSQTPDSPDTRNRIDQMEAQLANLTAWVHYQKAGSADKTPPPRSLSSTKSLTDSSDTFPASSNSKTKDENVPNSTKSAPNLVVSKKGLSDLTDSSGSHRRSSAQSIPSNPSVTSSQSTPRGKPSEVRSKLNQLRSDLHGLRRQQQLNIESMREEILETFGKIKSVISSKPGVDNQVNVYRRMEAMQVKQTYQTDKHQVDKELSDLEFSVEELRNDVVSRQCRVNMVDVEGMALLLSNVTKQMADLKARFPEIQDQMKQVMDGELRQVVSEEKFLKDEPTKIESSLKRCKKMTETLYTLKRLASVQDHRPPQVPTLPTSETPETDKMAVLENIRALVPDHDQRVQNMEAADAARERKKKISTQQESLKFGKSLEMATKSLKPSTSTAGLKPATSTGETVCEEKVKTSQATLSSAAPKPAIPSKPTARVSFSTTTSISSSASPTSSQVTTSSSRSSLKQSEKPTATVSALTSVNTPATNTISTIATTKQNSTGIKPLSSSATINPVSNSIQSGLGIVTSTVQSPSHTSKKFEPNSPIKLTSPVKPPVFTRPPTLGISGINRSPTRENRKIEKESENEKIVSPKVSFSNKDTISPQSKENSSPTKCQSNEKSDPKGINGHDSVKVEKADLATQKQAARSAFFSSMNTPPTSPDVKSPNRDSAILDPGPVVRPGPSATVPSKNTSGPTINLVLSGSVSPQSPTNPGAFTICPPKELVSTGTTAVSNKSPLTSPSKSSIPISDKITNNSPSSPLSLDCQESNDVVLRNKKVPPPPPPRKTSRPTSASLSPPINNKDSINEESTPRFVGGILGQHRLSGGPLSSTPKPTSQNTISTFDKDLKNGLNSKTSPKKNSANTGSSNNKVDGSVPCGDAQKCAHSLASNFLPPPPPHVTMALDREERGSSSESSSSSSSQSMGSQQSVVSVIASKPPSSKAGSESTVKPQSNPANFNNNSNTSTFAKSSKPDPPRRHSSLLSKFTGSSRDAKNINKNGNANINGVDL